MENLPIPRPSLCPRLACLAATGALLLPTVAVRTQTNPASPFGITALTAAPIYGPAQDTVGNPHITWRAFSGITSFRHPANGHDYAVGCASDGILIVDATANSGDGGPAVATAVNGSWWWIPETGWSPCSTSDQRTSGTYPITASNPLGKLMTTDTRNREAVAFVDNGTVWLYSANHFRSGIWILELPPPAAWPPSQSILEPTYSTWAFTPTTTGLEGRYPGVVGRTEVPDGTEVVHEYGGGHTISIDRAHRQVYVCGNHAIVPDWALPTQAGDFSSTMTVYDITSNPRTLAYRDTLRTTTSQSFGSWTAPASTHDVQILGRWCVVSCIDAAPGGGLAATNSFPCWILIDITNGWQGAATARMFASGVPPHSAWFDGRYLWGLNELNTLNLAIYDVEAPAEPVRIVASLDTPQAPSGFPAILHHIRAIGHTGFLAHYQDGVHVMDLRNGGLPASAPIGQRLLANLDTSPLTYPQSGTIPIFENKFQGVWDVATDFDTGIVCATQVGSPLGENAGVLVLRHDIGGVNRYWTETPFPPGAPSQGHAPRIALPESPPRTGQNLILIDENWSRYPNGVAVCYLGLTAPLVPTIDPHEFRWNMIPSTVLLQMVLVNPNIDATGQYPAGHCVVPIPPGFPVGLSIFCQIVAQEGSTRFAASRGTWFGVGG